MSAPPQRFYDDGLIQLDQEALTLRRYHFPSGTSKVIRLRDIRGYSTSPLGLFIHRFRLWGSSDLKHWLPLDTRRPLKSTLVTLNVAGMRLDPACTPEHPEQFVELLEDLLEQSR